MLSDRLSGIAVLNETEIHAEPGDASVFAWRLSFAAPRHAR